MTVVDLEVFMKKIDLIVHAPHFYTMKGIYMKKRNSEGFMNIQNQSGISLKKSFGK